MDTLGNARYFSVLDLKPGFHQIKMAEEAKKVMAFITRKGLNEYNFMPFELATNPSAFSRFLSRTFSDMIWDEAIFYIDHIIIFAKKQRRT